MKITVNEERFQKPTEILCGEFPKDIRETLEIKAVRREQAGLAIEKKKENVTITYGEDVQYYRALGIVLNHAAEESFSCAEEAYAKRLGNMLDCSRNAVPKTETVKQYIRYMALLGMNDLLLYTEDTYEVEGYPHFGAFRGRYTKEELQELDAYAAMFGITLVPCIQTLAHLHTYLRWHTADGMRDNQDILLAGEERVYALIEAMLKSVRQAFSGKRIHIGMDEAFDLGLGNYLMKNGYQDRTGIMKAHLERVYEICRKYEFEPMIWSDMYFMLASEDKRYYSVKEDYEWKETDKPDPGISLVYWDYYNGSEEVYKKMVRLHRKLSPQMYFAGGGWTWNGIAPNYARAFETAKRGLKVMKECGVRNWFCTFWGDDGAETPMETGVLSMTYFAELAYHTSVTWEDIKRRMGEVFGINADAMLLLDAFDNCDEKDAHNMKSGDPSKWALYQDVMLGVFDGQFQGKGLAAHYRKLAKKLAEQEIGTEKFAELYEYYRVLARLLAEKAELGIRLKSSYDAGDKEALAGLADETMEDCIRLTEELHARREKLWMDKNKPQGYEVLDIRLCGVKGRLLSAQRRVRAYLDGETPRLEELEEERVCFGKEGENFFFHNRWEQTASASNLCEI